MAPLPRVCVIGAGSSGIAVVKALKDRGLPHACFEKGDELGGNWCFRNSNGMSAAYESLHINTDAKLMEYRDYPMPPATPDYPSHRVIKAYFDDYADRFGLREHIRFGTEVMRAQRRDDGAWAITLDSGATEVFDALVVANGHHWDPRWPEPAYPGEFHGEQVHSHAYLNPREPVNCHFISAPGNDLPLWERMVKPGIDNLFFVGLLQPLGAIMPVAEAQGRFVGDHLLGRVALPDPPTMAREMARERAAMFRRYRDHSPRHTMQVDFEDYLHRLRKQARRGAKQARRLGQPLPVPARAGADPG